MILCAKCKKKPDQLTEKTVVIDHRIDVTARCHGEEETKSLSRKSLLDAEKGELAFFAHHAPVAKPRRKVGPGT